MDRSYNELLKAVCLFIEQSLAIPSNVSVRQTIGNDSGELSVRRTFAYDSAAAAAVRFRFHHPVRLSSFTPPPERIGPTIF